MANREESGAGAVLAGLAVLALAGGLALALRRRNDRRMMEYTDGVPMPDPEEVGVHIDPALPILVIQRKKGMIRQQQLARAEHQIGDLRRTLRVIFHFSKGAQKSEVLRMATLVETLDKMRQRTATSEGKNG